MFSKSKMAPQREKFTLPSKNPGSDFRNHFMKIRYFFPLREDRAAKVGERKILSMKTNESLNSVNPMGRATFWSKK